MCCWRLLECARCSKRNSTAQNFVFQRSESRSEEEKKKVDRICKDQAREMGAHYQFQNLLGSFQARRFCTVLCSITWANQLSVASSDDTGIAAVPSIHAVNSGNNKQATSKRHRRRVSIRNHFFLSR